jgi:hypothetical protein
VCSVTHVAPPSLDDSTAEPRVRHMTRGGRGLAAGVATARPPSRWVSRRGGGLGLLAVAALAAGTTGGAGAGVGLSARAGGRGSATGVGSGAGVGWSTAASGVGRDMTPHTLSPTTATNTMAAPITMRERDVLDACSAARFSRMAARSAVHSSQIAKCPAMAVRSRWNRVPSR